MSCLVEQERQMAACMQPATESGCVHGAISDKHGPAVHGCCLRDPRRGGRRLAYKKCDTLAHLTQLLLREPLTPTRNFACIHAYSLPCLCGRGCSKSCGGRAPTISGSPACSQPQCRTAHQRGGLQLPGSLVICMPAASSTCLFTCIHTCRLLHCV